MGKVVWGILISFVIIFLIGLIIRQLYLSFVKKYSILLNKVQEINKRYAFYKFSCECDLSHTYDNEKFFQNISEEDYLIYQLQFYNYKNKVLNQIGFMNYNYLNFPKYQNEIKELTIKNEYSKKPKGYVVKLLNYYENKLYQKSLQNPVTSFYLKVTLYLAKINGQVYNKKEKTFTSEKIKNLVNRLKNKNGDFYLDKGIWDAISRVERGRVTNKMRFAVYKRDGYRCRYCHRSQNVAVLEVDHIIPIAKGGKSTFDNLQTLCRTCNSIKSDRLL